MQHNFTPMPPPTWQEAEAKSRINLALDGMDTRSKIQILQEVAESYKAMDDKYRYLAMGPLWEEQVELQGKLIKKLENVRLCWALLAILEFLVLIYKFWE